MEVDGRLVRKEFLSQLLAVGDDHPDVGLHCPDLIPELGRVHAFGFEDRDFGSDLDGEFGNGGGRHLRATTCPSVGLGDDEPDLVGLDETPKRWDPERARAEEDHTHVRITRP